MVRTRRKNYDREEYEEHDEIHSSQEREETLLDRRTRWSTLLYAHNYRTVITEVLALELPKYTTSTVIVPTSLSSIISECVLILASAPLIFTAAVDGTLTQQYPVDSNLQLEYRRIQERAHIQPSIYIHLLADDDGVAPSAKQYMVIRDTILKYIDDVEPDHELAYFIDNIYPPSSLKASSTYEFRKYLQTAATLRSPHRVEALHRFCEGILQRYLSTPSQSRNLPFAHPPGECGYARNSHTRLSQHRNRQSSNYIMNLTEDICSHLNTTRQFPQLFRMHQFIIYLIFRPRQAEIAEVFCSGLLQVWTENGGGFNHYPAGRSNRSARDVSVQAWNEHETYARGNTMLLENLERQREMVEDAVRLLNEQAAIIWREVLESLGDFRYTTSL